MRDWRRWIVVCTVLGLGGAPSGAPARDGATWITLERSVADGARAAFAAAGRAGALAVEGEGEVVVARLAEADISRLSGWVHRTLGHCGGFMGHATREEALAEAARANGEPAREVPQIDYTIDNPAVVQALMAEIQESNVSMIIERLSSNFTTRHHNCSSGAASANWIWRVWSRYAEGQPGVTVDMFIHTGYTTQQPSVILTIRGTDLASEVVVLGAHQDSTAGSACGLAPGADDDATGVAGLTEIIRAALAQGYRPRRTVKFMAYAAEEVGLRGSNEIAARHQQKGINVVGVLQLDMTGYAGSASDIYLVNDNTNAAQNAFVGDLIDTYLSSLTWGLTYCQYGCSDHASWHSRGYAASFPFEAYFGPYPPSPGYSPYIHTTGDTLASIGNNADHAVKFTRLAAAYMAELAKGTVQ
jgi:bacterial leucyl aminopeptidase